MSRSANPIPTYRHHKKTGRAIVTVRDHAGARRDILLPGLHGSPESLEEYERACAQLRANRGRLPAEKAMADLTIAELILRYMKEHVVSYYVNPTTGEPTTEQRSIREACIPLNRLFGSLPAAEFDCTKLETVRNAMMDGSWMNEKERELRDKRNREHGWCRTLINRHVHRIRRLFRWGLARKLVPATVLVEITAVSGLKRGRSAARESAPVLPVDPATVETTLPKCPPVVADMVRVQLLSGARPGEVCAMKVRELDMTGPVWFYL